MSRLLEKVKGKGTREKSKGKGKKAGSDSAEGGGNDRACKFHAAGNCKWGDECKFIHSENTGGTPSGTPHLRAVKKAKTSADFTPKARVSKVILAGTCALISPSPHQCPK